MSKKKPEQKLTEKQKYFQALLAEEQDRTDEATVEVAVEALKMFGIESGIGKYLHVTLDGDKKKEYALFIQRAEIEKFLALVKQIALEQLIQ